ncbi:MAG: M23 family metallopeptidase [Bacilli bacterium]
MIKSNVKKMLVPTIYLTSITLIIGSIVLLITGVNKYLTVPSEYDYTYRGIFNNETIPVMNEATAIVKPYLSENVKIGKYFYDYEGDIKEQEGSLIYFESTYMQNSGIDYISETVFDVVSVLDGEVTKVEKNPTLGNIIQIKHANNLITIYEGVANVTVKIGDKVTQGQVLSISGNSLVNSNYTTSLHFEVYHKGEIIDPETFYSSNIQDFQ